MLMNECQWLFHALVSCQRGARRAQLASWGGMLSLARQGGERKEFARLGGFPAPCLPGLSKDGLGHCHTWFPRPSPVGSEPLQDQSSWESVGCPKCSSAEARQFLHLSAQLIPLQLWAQGTHCTLQHCLPKSIQTPTWILLGHNYRMTTQHPLHK